MSIDKSAGSDPRGIYIATSTSASRPHPTPAFTRTHRQLTSFLLALPINHTSFSQGHCPVVKTFSNLLSSYVPLRLRSCLH